ncbi:MAG TPA: hypothetical protein VER97_08570 [Geodermatophilus sp.]|nr:hypothetical protein [Geodermatophilus sp.]
MFLVVFLLVPVPALITLVALEARLHGHRSLAGAGRRAHRLRPADLHGKGRNRVS